MTGESIDLTDRTSDQQVRTASGKPRGARSAFSLDYFDPPEHLAKYVLAFFHFSWDEPCVEDRHPGALPQLVFFPNGSGEIEFSGKHQTVDGPAYLFAGFTTAAPFKMNGPWQAFGASLSPFGWAALTGQPAHQNVDRFIAPATMIDADVDRFARETNTSYRSGELSGEQACHKLADWLTPRFKPIPARHEKLIEGTLAWLGSSLNPDIDELLDRLAYSRRQSERLIERYFGFPPAALARKLRAIRAAAILAQDNLSEADMKVVSNAFYDQPHMVREIRHFCGFTPTRLGGDAEQIFQTMLRMKNFSRLTGSKS